MAEAFEFEIKPKGIDATVRELRGLETQLDGVSDSMDGAGGSSSNMAANITAGVVAAQAAVAIMTKLAGAVAAAADEFERQAGIMNRFTGDIDEAARRTNGLISNLDLMTASSRASAAGLSLTADQFATVSVRAAEFAARTGGDATEALNSLIGAIATGRAGQLLQYGVDLQGITSITDKQTAALDGLTDGFGEAESSADTFGGRLRVLETEFDNAKTRAIELVAQSGLMEQGFDNLAIAASALSGDVGEVSGELGIMEQAAIAAAATFEALTAELAFFGRMVGAMTTSGDLDDLVASSRQLQEIWDGRDTRSFTDRVGENIAAASRQGSTVGVPDGIAAPGPGGAAARAGGSSRRTASPTDDGGAADRALESQARVLEIMEEQYNLQQASFDNDAAKQAVVGELAKLEQERLDIMAQQTAETMKQKEATQEAADAELDRQSNMRKAKSIQASVADGYKGIADITRETIRLTEEGGVSASKAFAMALDEWLKNLAIQEAISGAVAFAEGVGNAVMNTGHSAAKFAESAQHFAIAAVAGGASVAIPNSGGGGSGGGGDASRPDTSAGAGSTEGGGNTVINYNSPVAEAQLGRDQARANRAAARTFDA